MNFILFFLVLLYMEACYHMISFGMVAVQPGLMLAGILVIAGIESLITGIWKEKINSRITWVIFSVQFLFFSAQIIYMNVFNQPLLPMAAAVAGKDAITSYWREIFVWIGQCWFGILLMAIPLLLYGILCWKEKVNQNSISLKMRFSYFTIATFGVVAYVAILFYGKNMETTFFEAYSEFYSPADVAKEMGMLPTFQRACTGSLFEANEVFVYTDDIMTQLEGEDSVENVLTEDTIVQGEEAIVYEKQQMNINFSELIELCDSEELEKTLQYFAQSTTTYTNEYTGMFEGYNLIYITAEGFSPFAVDENLTPTLYKLVGEGFSFTDYYAPLWQTSTSDGEYVNLTGLIPDQQFSMRRSADNEMPFTLAKYFGSEQYVTTAYHNNTLSYYEREETHPNLGYDWRASKLGDLSEEEWGDHIFTMEQKNEWPSSDYNMMVGTIPEYINEDAFHIYYMTVSGHMNYNFQGNKMSYNNMEAVADLPYGEEARAYIACHIELDKALEYLIEQLELAGKLENTVICMATDHYPYGMSVESLEEISGKTLENHDIYKSNLIIWNSEMETVVVDKACCAIDITPTLLNLFGFDYDSRLYAGKDILSDAEGLVIFSDRSYITDSLEYVKDDKEYVIRDSVEITEQYIEEIELLVKQRYLFSAAILNNNFYEYVQNAM